MGGGGFVVTLSRNEGKIRGGRGKARDKVSDEAALPCLPLEEKCLAVVP